MCHVSFWSLHGPTSTKRRNGISDILQHRHCHCQVAACATAAVTGLQGDGGSGPNTYLQPGRIVAEAKHFGGYGGGSKDGAPVEVGMGALHDIYLRPWKAAAKAGLRALMASHNDINGRPCHSNPYLLTKIMREEFGFGDALIASDGHDVNRVFYTGTCIDAVDAAVQCLAAGMDQDLGGMSFGPRYALRLHSSSLWHHSCIILLLCCTV